MFVYLILQTRKKIFRTLKISIFNFSKYYKKDTKGVKIVFMLNFPPNVFMLNKKKINYMYNNLRSHVIHQKLQGWKLSLNPQYKDKKYYFFADNNISVSVFFLRFLPKNCNVCFKFLSCLSFTYIYMCLLSIFHSSHTRLFIFQI